MPLFALLCERPDRVDCTHVLDAARTSGATPGSPQSSGLDARQWRLGFEPQISRKVRVAFQYVFQLALLPADPQPCVKPFQQSLATLLCVVDWRLDRLVHLEPLVFEVDDRQSASSS